MTNNVNELVWHDGAQIKAQYLVGMAKKAGSYALTEHYLVSLLAHGVMHGLYDYIDVVNEVRAYYQVEAIPVPKQEQMTVYGKRNDSSIEVKVKKGYAGMNIEKRYEIMRTSLQYLRAQYNLFLHKNDWMGIMLVVKDRLDGSINQNNFTNFARHITPDDWPCSLRIGDTSHKNFSRLLSPKDRKLAYYDMEANPQAQLCEKFWEVVTEVILTEIA